MSPMNDASVRDRAKNLARKTGVSPQAILQMHLLERLLARIAKSAIDELKEEGINIGMIRPITLWPFPTKALHDAAVAPGIKAVLDVELNAGQMLEDVKLAVNGENKVDFFGHYGSQMPTPEEIKAKLLSMREVL